MTIKEIRMGEHHLVPQKVALQKKNQSPAQRNQNQKSRSIAMVNIDELNQKIEKESILLTHVREELKKSIIGQQLMVDRLLVALLTGGHVLLEGVPGLAKTRTIKALSDVISATFKRIQFTPDLLPADIVGTLIYNQKSGEFLTKKGPLFANIILADEINRSPAKVQSALLEGMQEKQVTIGDTTYPLPQPFFVLATQNPIEQEGTYPLPEAQVDRFMLKVKVDYPTKKEEQSILDLVEHESSNSQLNTILTSEQITTFQSITEDIYIDDKLKQYIVELVFATRNPSDYGLSKLSSLIDFGASPRASINLMKASKAVAFMGKRGYVIPDDIKEIAFDVLRHRIMLSYEAEAEQIDVEEVIREIIHEIEVP
jgi:MoxR-like ATPase